MKSLSIDALPPALDHLKPTEQWTRDPSDPDLWHGPNGLIVNSAALAERAIYFRIERSRPVTARIAAHAKQHPIAG